MIHVNENYLELQGSYLFSTIARKVAAYSEANPDKKLIRLGIGDVTQPLAPVFIEALHKAVEEMGKAETFRGYAPDLGYDFLRNAIAGEYKTRGCDVSADEVFVSDGAKSDSGNIQEIFSADSRIAVCDPVYPVYVDSNVMAGRSGRWDPETGRYSNFLYMPCTEENGFMPELPGETGNRGTASARGTVSSSGSASACSSAPDLIYLCFPNNPTGMTMTKDQLQVWVDYANRNGAVILYDAAYEAYITEPDIPHSIYECEGARTCAIEIRSFSKNAGFTGLRLGFTVVPKELKAADGTMLHTMWARRHGTKFNGAPYIVQRAGAAAFTPEGQAAIREQVSYYMKNAAVIREGLQAAGYTVYGGINAPYIWLKTPDGLTSWKFFDRLLETVQIVGTPGSGFGPSGEGYFRLTAFGTYENTVAAIERIRNGIRF